MITAENIFENFKSTISGLEKGLQVLHITTSVAQLLCCREEDDIETVLEHDDLKQFDQIPVKRQETIIGLLKRRECPVGSKGTAGKHMQPLGEEILVSADTPLLDFIQNTSLDRLVINGMNIYGLVTKSDLLKLPVYLLGFALVTHVETLMLHLIRETDMGKEEWMMLLKRGRRIYIRDKFEQLISQRSDPDMLELTSFSDKSKILGRLVTIEKYAPYLPHKCFIDQLSEITDFRNSIAHTGNTSDNDDILQKFIGRLQKTYKWIKDIEAWQTDKANSTH